MATLTLDFEDAAFEHFERRSEDLDMQPTEYVALALSVCDSLPDYLLFAVAAGIPVEFFCAAEVGGASGGD